MPESWYVRLTYRRNHQRDRRLRPSANGVKTNQRLAMEKKDSLKDGPISCSSKISFILFLADNDPTTGQSWCPAGDRPAWRTRTHSWRVDSRFKLIGVPTLVRWDGDSVKGRLEDHQAHLILPLLAPST
ncbi:unnamed protein product [Arabidopsis arenosa]|uniref:Thioredoxin domain-containing protein n=1 Tax=Arabidopsis arenosa TaxID=38785 RepID=A0A8S2B4N3_ARAAE|nr:unnamed protein product [Arabidopsis arenosa]